MGDVTQIDEFSKFSQTIEFLSSRNKNILNTFTGNLQTEELTIWKDLINSKRIQLEQFNLNIVRRQVKIKRSNIENNN